MVPNGAGRHRVVGIIKSRIIKSRVVESRIVAALSGVVALVAAMVVLAPSAAAAEGSDGWSFYGGNATSNAQPLDTGVAHTITVQLGYFATSTDQADTISGAQLTATMTGPSGLIDQISGSGVNVDKGTGTATYVWDVPTFHGGESGSTQMSFTVPAGAASSGDELTVALTQSDSATTHDGQHNLPGMFTAITYNFTTPPSPATHTVTIKKSWYDAVSGDTAAVTISDGTTSTTGHSTAPDGDSSPSADVVTWQFPVGATVTISETMGNNDGRLYRAEFPGGGCDNAYASPTDAADTWTFTMPDKDVTCTLSNTQELPEAPLVQKHVTIERPDGSGGFTDVGGDFDTARIGDTLKYTIDVQGAGTLPYTGPIATDDLAQVTGVDFSSLTQSGITVAGSGLSATLKSGPSIALTADDVAPSISGTVTFSGIVIGAGSDLGGAIYNGLSDFANLSACIIADRDNGCGVRVDVAAQVSLTKDWTNGHAGDAVDLTVTSSDDETPSANGSAAVGSPARDAVLYLDSGDESTVTITETADSGTDLADYDATWSCTVPAAGTYGDADKTWSGTGTSGTIDLSEVGGLADGGHVSCAFTNVGPAPATSSSQTAPATSSSHTLPTSTPPASDQTARTSSPTSPATSSASTVTTSHAPAAVIPASSAPTATVHAAVHPLAYTGAPVKQMVTVALLLLLIGAGSVILAHRRVARRH